MFENPEFILLYFIIGAVFGAVTFVLFYTIRELIWTQPSRPQVSQV